jgi:hypothetical protein
MMTPAAEDGSTMAKVGVSVSQCAQCYPHELVTTDAPVILASAVELATTLPVMEGLDGRILLRRVALGLAEGEEGDSEEGISDEESLVDEAVTGAVIS